MKSLLKNTRVSRLEDHGIYAREHMTWCTKVNEIRHNDGAICLSVVNLSINVASIFMRTIAFTVIVNSGRR